MSERDLRQHVVPLRTPRNRRGTEVEVVFATDDALTFGAQLLDGPERFNQSTGDASTGTMTVDAVGDTFCAQVDFVDHDKQIVGTFDAPVIGEL